MAQEHRAKQVALCLSGGGFRAALFHAGALKRLNELGILSRATTICSVSGGSVINGVATRWPELAESERNGVFVAFVELIAERNYECRKDLRTEVLLWDRGHPLNWPELLQRDYSGTDRLAVSYAEHRDLGKQFSSLPSAPEFLFLAILDSFTEGEICALINRDYAPANMAPRFGKLFRTSAGRSVPGQTRLLRRRRYATQATLDSKGIMAVYQAARGRVVLKRCGGAKC